MLLGFGPLSGEERAAEVAARVPGTTVRSVPYDVSHEARTAAGAAPFDPAARALLAEPTDAQREAFAAAEVLLALDGPAGLGALAPNLRLVQTVGSGVGQWRACDLDPDRVAVCNAAGLTAPAIAEWVLGQVLRVLKRIDRVAELQRERRWQQTFGEQLSGRRMAVVGLGEIGSAVAVRAAAFGVEVHGVRRTPGEPPAGVTRLHHPDALADVLARCDLVVGCLPGAPGTEDVFDAAAFAAMPVGTIFVNVGRGSSVVEPDLVEALRSGHLRAACLDVTRVEPVPEDSDLWDCPRLHLSPHSAAAPGALLVGVWERFLLNLAAHVEGRPLQHRVRLADL